MVNANQNVYVREKKAEGDAVIQVKTLSAQSIKAKFLIGNFNFYSNIRVEYFIVVKALWSWVGIAIGLRSLKDLNVYMFNCLFVS